MVKGFNSVVSENGFTIWLPPNPQSEVLINLNIPTPAEIWAEHSSKLWPFGTKLTADERVWRYCYSGGVCDYARGAGNYNKHIEGSSIGDAVAAAYTINWRISDTDYPAVGYVAENTYEGGYLWIMHTIPALYKIISSLVATGAVAATDYITLTLEDPITTAGATPWCTAYRNNWSDCRADYPSQPPNITNIVCVPMQAITAARYHWGQTWGPVWITHISDSPGNSSNEREMVFAAGGVIQTAHQSGYEAHQRAGHIMTFNENTNDCMLMLQICP